MSKRLGGIKGYKYKTSSWHLNTQEKGHTGYIYIYILLLLFLTFSVLVANLKKLLYTVANPARGLLNREKITKEKVWQYTPPTPHTARSKKIFFFFFFFIHLPSAVRVLIFIARRIQPFLSLVDREVEFCVVLTL